MKINSTWWDFKSTRIERLRALQKAQVPLDKYSRYDWNNLPDEVRAAVAALNIDALFE